MIIGRQAAGETFEAPPARYNNLELSHPKGTLYPPSPKLRLQSGGVQRERTAPTIPASSSNLVQLSFALILFLTKLVLSSYNLVISRSYEYNPFSNTYHYDLSPYKISPLNCFEFFNHFTTSFPLYPLPLPLVARTTNRANKSTPTHLTLASVANTLVSAAPRRVTRLPYFLEKAVNMENPEDYAFQLSTKGYKLSDEEKRLCGAKVLIHSVTSSEAPSDSTWSWETDLSTIKSSGGTEGVIVGVSLGRSTDQQVKIKMAATRPQAKSIAQILQEDDIDDLISNVNDAVPVVAVIQKTARYYELRIDHQITGKALAGNGFHQRNVFFFAIFRNDEISAHDTRRRKWAEKVRTYGQQRQENLQQGDPLTISRPSKSLASPPRQESPEPAPAISNSITNGLEATLSAIPSDNNQYPSIVVAVFRLEAELSRDDGGPRDIDKEKGGEEGAEDDNGFTEHEASQFNDCYVELMVSKHSTEASFHRATPFYN